MAGAELATQPHRGFTLVEVMLALTIMAIGVLSLGALQLMTMEYGNRGKHASQASAIAQSQIEQLQRVTWTDASIQPTAGWSGPVQVNAQVQDGAGTVVAQSFDVFVRVSNASAGLTRNLDVRVDWDEPTRPGRSFALSTLRFNLEGL
jgi:type IV pilus assembly protein PilV